MVTADSLQVLEHLFKSTLARNKRTSADAICRALGKPLGEVNPCLYELRRHGLVDYVPSGRTGGPLRWRISAHSQARAVLVAAGVVYLAPAGPRLRPSALAARPLCAS